MPCENGLGPLNSFPLIAGRMLNFASRGHWRVMAWWLLQCLTLAVQVAYLESLGQCKTLPLVPDIKAWSAFTVIAPAEHCNQQRLLASSSPSMQSAFPGSVEGM